MKRALVIAVAVIASVGAVLWYAPPLLPDTRIVNEITIARPPQQVYDYVTTPANWPRWHPSSLAVRGATDHPLVPGESVVEEFIVAGNRGTVTWTVVSREAPVRWSIDGKNTGSRGGGSVTYALRPEGGGTRFERVLTYHMPNLLAAILNDFGVRDRVAAESAEAVARLKAELEKREHTDLQHRDGDGPGKGEHRRDVQGPRGDGGESAPARKTLATVLSLVMR